MKKILFCAFAMAVFFTAQPAPAQIQGDGKPGLIITPNRIELSGRQRSAVITLANSGTKQGYYRIQLVNKLMTEDGRLLDATENDASDMFADRILRLSPRSVTLEPGANQNIRLMVRKPKDLADGEYRSHLSVMILPDDAENASDDEVADDKLVIAIKANYGVTIPVIVRHGDVSAAAKMGKISYHQSGDSDKTHPALKFTISRTGNASLYGDIKVIHVNNNGNESVIKFMGGLAIYTPNEKRNFEIPLDGEAKISGGGTIKVIYQEKEKSGGKMIAQNELKL